MAPPRAEAREKPPFSLSPKCPQAEDDIPASDLTKLNSFARSLESRAECASHPDVRLAASFLTLKGAVQRQLGDNTAAMQSLEQALMLDADRADALLEYALTKEAAGDRASAIEMYRAILEKMDPPPPVAALLRQRLNALRPTSESVLTQSVDPKHRVDRRSGTESNQQARQLAKVRLNQSLHTQLGFDHNLNAAIRSSTLLLTFPDGPVALDLAESERRRSGAVAGMEHRLSAQWHGAQSQWQWQQRISQRQPLDLPENRSTQIEGELVMRPQWSSTAFVSPTHDAPGSHWQPALALGAQQLAYGGSTLAQSIRAQFSLAQAAARISWDVESKRFPERSTLNGKSSTLGIRLLREGNDLPFELFARITSDWPEASRPGGRQKRIELGLAKSFSDGLGLPGLTGERSTNVAQMLAGSTRDENGYNPLIENNKIRWVGRFSIGFERATPVRGPWEITQQIDCYRQNSNLALFQSEGWSLLLGVRRLW